ncbi:hypothetical protein C9374_002739 [Naegleria lovaniensis]|uniref:Uncharacterized protein n=1 Tax=Naegleria lovaniensis TaxID=51637 RepID=A0AA88GUM4_NAELO|nr:uncharacterized protein C9374_002739 [Naegleria lovaniensis]KAG2386293.1 hypothetical protein C9374_002739 [Naegleria lovaniensis]
MGAEGVSIIQHVYELNRDRPNYLTTVSVRRILDYISIYCALCGLIPVVILSIIALSASSGENESLRRTLTFAVGVPLVGIGTAIVFLFGIIAVVAIVLMLRSSAKYTPSDSEVYRLQLQSMMKLTVGVVIMSLGAVLEVVGIVTNYLEMPNFIVYPLAKGVPYITFMICISLIFWPYRLPLLSHPIQFVTQELRFSPKTKEETLVDVAQVEHEMK